MIALVFPGQGSQHRGMGRELFERWPDLTAQADETLGYSIARLCLSDPDGQLDDTRYTQPAVYVVNALAYRDWSERHDTPPDFLAGHSLGEYNALEAAGVFDFAGGLRLVQRRAELMAQATGGGMAVVIGLGADGIADVLARHGGGDIDIANYNTADQLVISGPGESITHVIPRLVTAGADCLTLPVSGAFHSRYMRGAAAAFADFMTGCELAPPRIPVIANTTAAPHGRDIGAELARQIAAPVRWTDSVRHLLDAGVSDFQQLGPGTAVMGMVRAIRAAQPRPAPVRQPQGDEAYVRLLERDLLDRAREMLAVTGEQSAALTSTEELAALGFGSLKLIEFSGRLSDLLGADVAPSVFFQHHTVGALARHLVSAHRDRMPYVYPAGSTAGDLPLTADTAEPAHPVLPAPVPARSPRVADGPVSAAAATDEPIAVIGVSGVFPGADDLRGFWQNQLAGHDAVAEVPADRWDWRSANGGCENPSEQEAPQRWGAFLRDAAAFDCSFFGISPGEALLMDPQQRLFLQTVWHAVENAGYRPSDLAGSRTGVFAAVSGMDYVEALTAAGTPVDARTATGLAHSVLVNRVSYLLNLRGPSEPVDTACSSSLVAVHRAVRSIRLGECDQAIAGGVNVLAGPSGFVSFAQAGMLARDGHCKAFDARADGYVRGEGVAAVVLKPLARAEADGDHVHAVIRGSAVGHGGRTASLTAPSPDRQADVIVTAWRQSGLDPSTAGLIEAHGTGTELGDPVEIEGLRQAFRTLYDDWSLADPDEPHCGIGSVKTSIGHLEAAAGMAGLVKAILAVQRGRRPALRGFTTPNPHLRLAGSPFHLLDRTRSWPRSVGPDGRALPRRAGISSFGFGGVNAHVVLEEYLPAAPVPRPRPDGRAHIVPLSARSAERLRAQAEQLGALLRDTPAPDDAPAYGLPDPGDLPDLAATLQTGREAMPHRLAVVARNLQELRAGLESFCRHDTEASGVHTGVATDALADLGADPPGAAYLAELTAAGRFDRLAQLWTSGVALDWPVLRTSGPYRRLPLPGYPFEPRRFWPRPQTSRAAAPPPQTNRAAAPVGSGQHADTASAPASSSPPTGIAEALLDEFADVLKWDRTEIGVDTPFERLGLDSLTVLQLRKRLDKRYGPLSPTVFYTYKNLRDLASYLARNSTPAPVTGDDLSSPTLPTRGEPSASGLDIAIVGMSGRYPGSRTVAGFWRNLLNGVDSVGEIPLDRPGFRRYAELSRERHGDNWPRWGGFLDDVDAFDATFFHIAPVEARFLDPQQRLFIETAWECVEDAGYTSDTLADPAAGDRRAPVGVFCGLTYNNYQLFGAEAVARGEWVAVESQTFSAANRVSYLMNLGGPSLTVDTACSSSLYAVHLACESIRRGECDAAIAGGANLSLHPTKYMTLQEAGFLASDGRCRAFGAGGDGYVPAEAVGAVLLKPLARALSDNDHVYAVIKGSAVNSDGRTFGYSVPNPVAQTELIQAALMSAGITADTIGYVEAHGTGTSLGDPIEMRALTDAYAPAARVGQYCAVGSVKSNIGHAEAAAGIAQLTKTALQLRHRTLAPTLLHSDRTNPEIPFEDTPFKVQAVRERWEPLREPDGTPLPRRAGISSFGAGGVNVHVVLEEAPEQAPRRRSDGRPRVLVLSADNEAALRRYAARLRAFLADGGSGPDDPVDEAGTLLDLAYTLQCGRSALPHRLAFVAADWKEADSALGAYLENGSPYDSAVGHPVVHTGVAPRGPRPEPAAGELAALAERGKWDDIARAWARGTSWAWQEMYTADESPRRTPAPVYPFSRDRYWIDDARRDAAAEPDGGADTGTVAALAALPESERQSFLVERLQEELGRLLQYSPGTLPDPDRGFVELGLESLFAVQLGVRIEEELGVPMYATVTFDHPTVRELARFLLEKIGSPTPQPTVTTSPATGPYSLVGKPESGLEKTFYELLWEADPLPDPADAPFAWSTGAVVFDRDETLTQALARHLRDLGSDAPVILVKPGLEYGRTGDDEYVVRPGQDTDCAALLADLAARPGGVPRVFVHRWACRADTAAPTLDALLDAGIRSVFPLARSLAALPTLVRLLVLDEYAEDEGPQPLVEAFGGFARCVRHETPRLICQSLAVAGETAGALPGPARVIEACGAELGVPEPPAEVRHSPGGRLVRRMRRLRPAAGDRQAVRLTPNGTYLITGGLGALGTAFAEHIARRAPGCTLVLAARSAPGPGRREVIDRIASTGATVEHVRADVGREDDVRRLLEHVRSRHGGLDGVIHAAGHIQDALLSNKTAEDVEQVLAGKLAGAVHLDALTQGDELDFFMTFSSLTSLTGNAGQSDYGYASAFLTAFARRREELRARGERTGRGIALIWPYMRDGGMRVDAATEGYLLRRHGLGSVDTDLATEAFDLSLATGGPEFGVLYADLGRLARTLPILKPEETPGRGAAGEDSGDELRNALTEELEELGL
ncbi:MULTISPECIES: type I polyketide synthase [unclassified Streptomyces]|uniref:type I polyketide synthase n=1 Tax=unclassified Streptomyces TaxID=2593676 RepID=UPI001BE972BC|nr:MULTISPECIES: type I polyketide synthase [unclassified Streptomyces]MBT2408798.1 ACP S-malonyltransferase [Streptomyces sp. ISL-21]MBT2458449.1 ACP S-malonyltransferase [Streptomyces sp. ISL-86]MBT2612428.1 ACP S-malonyltransferase [Streptomyces sp. ISL-87]